MKKVGLLDADIAAFKISSKMQNTYEWDEGEVTVACDLQDTCEKVDDFIEEIKETLDLDELIICLSDDYENFRKDVLPSYKGHRKNSTRPELLYEVKEYMFENYKSYRKDTLEADDVMGIIATNPKLFKGCRKIIISEDKDMRTIPGYLYNPNYPDVGVQQIGEVEANRFWMWQTLTGDTTDGYKGCKGIGEVKADKALEGLTQLDELWDVVEYLYSVQGHKEGDALVQARCARILRHGDYDYKTKEVKLWTPQKTI